MNKVVVFGKPGGGKSTLSRKLASAKGIPLHALDLIEYKKNGERVAFDEYSQKHAEIMTNDRWIIEGLGPLPLFWSRIDAADTLIYIDLPYYVHYWRVTKRLLKSFFVKPEGWPEGSAVIKGTLASWKYLRLSRTFWTPEMYSKIQVRGKGKHIYRLTSVKQLDDFIGNFPE